MMITSDSMFFNVIVFDRGARIKMAIIMRMTMMTMVIICVTIVRVMMIVTLQQQQRQAAASEWSAYDIIWLWW